MINKIEKKMDVNIMRRKRNIKSPIMIKIMKVKSGSDGKGIPEHLQRFIF